MHFPDPDSVDRDELYQWIGHPENITDPGFYNTCAIRMSLALLGAGFPNPGTYPIKAGKYKGRMIEPGQRRLSHWLVQHIGKPEKYKSGPEAEKAIESRHGIVSFFSIYGDGNPQGAYRDRRHGPLGEVHSMRPRDRRHGYRVLLDLARGVVLAAEVAMRPRTDLITTSRVDLALILLPAISWRRPACSHSAACRVEVAARVRALPGARRAPAR
jgi:hypothetical protein